jgi:DNA-binding transcriptional MocR family regulator
MTSYAVDRESDTPLYIQIRDNITEAIDSGSLFPGDKLPSVASLAKEIGVTQATIRRALQDLGKAGHTDCHVGRGTFITDANAPAKKDTVGDTPQKENSGDRQQKTHLAVSNPREFAARRLRSGVSKALYDIMLLAHKPGIIQLTKGIPDPNLLPDNFIEEVTQDALAGGSKQYIEATEALGMYELREEIAMRFNEGGAHITPDQVLITNGTLQAVTLIAEAALENRPDIVCETPCFQGIPDTFAAMGHWVETIQRDKEGPIMEKLNRLSGNDPRLLYLCSYAHNPTGYDLSSERHTQLVDWARKTGSTIVQHVDHRNTCPAECGVCYGCAACRGFGILDGIGNNLQCFGLALCVLDVL